MDILKSGWVVLPFALALAACDSGTPPAPTNGTKKPPAKKVEWTFTKRWSVKLDGDEFFTAATLSPDGKWLATMKKKGNSIVIYDAETGDLKFEKKNHEWNSWGAVVAFSQSGKYLAVATDGVVVRLYENPSGNLVASNEEALLERLEAAKVRYGPRLSPLPGALTFSPDEKRIAVGMNLHDPLFATCEFVQVLSIPDLKPQLYLPEGAGTIAAEFSEKGDVIYTAGYPLWNHQAEGRVLEVWREPGIRAWNLSTCQIVGLWMDEEFSTVMAAIDPSRNKAMAYLRPENNAGPARVTVWDLKPFKRVTSKRLENPVAGFAPYPGYEWFAGTATDACVYMVETATGNRVKVIDMKDHAECKPGNLAGQAAPTSFSSDGKLFGITNFGPGLWVFDVKRTEK